MLHGLPYQSRNATSTPNRADEAPTSGLVPSEQSQTSSTSSMTEPGSSVAVHNACTSTQVLLATAVVMVQNSRGKRFPCRAILDNGSQINILTQKMARRLNLDVKNAMLPICGINGVNTRSSQWTNLSFFAVHSPFSKTIGCYILPAITVSLPSRSFDVSGWSLHDNVRNALADPEFNISSEVDLLLGAEIYYELIRSQPLVMPGGLPWLYDTALGWVISGPLSKNDDHSVVEVSTVCALGTTTAWMNSEPLIRQTKHEEELAFERYFQDTHSRLADGRFVVRLPFRKEPSVLGGSMNMALKRFLTLEKKMCNNSELAREYKNFLKEYEEMGHMSKIDDTVATPGTYYYIPHHAVYKDSSSTTKLRVVFDASMKTTTDYSLNDILMTGPVVQQELFDIVLRFRYYLYVVTADVAKMYRQVLVHENDRHFQRILWRDAPDKPLQHYVLNTVTYGTVPASFLATRVLKELALGSAADYPKASLSILQDFYMDDYLSGADSMEDIKTMYQEVSKILENGGMQLRKWCSNAEELREHFACASTEKHYSLELSTDMTVSSLGLIWCPITDELKFLSKERTARSVKTKRDLLSTLNSVFDPLGFLGPVLIRGKVFLQELWQINLNWDDVLPEELQVRWATYIQELEGLHQLRIPRAVKTDGQGTMELHGFCDASQSAYGACIYLRQQIGLNSWTVRLLCAKSRVAPTKTLTIPRLELSGALLLAELMNRIVKLSNFNSKDVYCWCDSTVVLAWIQGTPAQWKTYVANRVTQILDAIGNERWRHVPTDCNPADPLSRGINVDALLSSDLWWNGPIFLRGVEEDWPITYESYTVSKEVSNERRPVKFTLTTTAPVDNRLLQYFSTWHKLLRMTAIWKRFIAWVRRRTKPTSPQPGTGPLSVIELNDSRDIWIKFVQQQAFSAEIQELSKGNFVTKGPLKNLSPFLDKGILRVGGRLKHSELDLNQKHPALLPRNHRVTQMIFEAYHKKFLHIGPQGLLANIRAHFWPLRGRDLARITVNKCIKCFRAKPIPMQPLMGQLPAARVSANRPFTHTGIDFAGPIMIKVGIRKSTLIKTYVSVFVCLSTKAVHLEPVSDLSADAFMACLRRFISRRGLPSHIWSDNATNFVGTKREIIKYYAKQRSGRTVYDELLDEGIQWIFIPPSAPHFGGVWEAAVKSCKYHLVRTILGTSFNFEELCTVLAQVEACLNSRPLTPLSSDPCDFKVLTPSHFLIGGPAQVIPEPDLLDIPANRLRKWALMQKTMQDFWRRWRMEYLSSLQVKNKWLKDEKPIPIGSLAILKEDNAPPLKWPMVRIEAVHPGRDKIVRVVTVRLANGNQLKRPAVKICPLPDS
ncbi:uncharacterized protein LOC126902051 [Daktulosphaira vitifoliae]|uniref:uncharacterized protein LOC126902051 n=1 Tax=Daktulosphaira vitifoliae TaxID=58002 RepID=UPI0021A9DE8C|nr:uncharacterized protein LOC126902051 [Daktulosphaira vitifoliae]